MNRRINNANKRSKGNLLVGIGLTMLLIPMSIAIIGGLVYLLTLIHWNPILIIILVGILYFIGAFFILITGLISRKNERRIQ